MGQVGQLEGYFLFQEPPLIDPTKSGMKRTKRRRGDEAGHGNGDGEGEGDHLLDGGEEILQRRARQLVDDELNLVDWVQPQATLKRVKRAPIPGSEETKPSGGDAEVTEEVQKAELGAGNADHQPGGATPTDGGDQPAAQKDHGQTGAEEVKEADIAADGQAIIETVIEPSQWQQPENPPEYLSFEDPMFKNQWHLVIDLLFFSPLTCSGCVVTPPISLSFFSFSFRSTIWRATT